MDKRVLLAERLRERTLAGAIAWEETADEEVFQAAFSNLTLRIASYFDDVLDESVVEIEIFNSQGQRIDAFTDVTLKSVGMQAPWSVMFETHQAARRIAMGVENALDSLLNELNPNTDSL